MKPAQNCNLCGKEFSSQSSLNRHILSQQRHLASVHSEAKPFACSECDYKASSKSELKCHSRRHSTKRDFKCSYPQCVQSFKSPGNLKRHFSSLHELRSIPCDHPGCTKKYANTQALHQHKKDVHSKKSLVCPNLNCSNRTHSSHKLVRHMIIHNGENKKLSCSMESCRYIGKNNRALGMHMHLHKSLLTCPVPGCGGYGASEKTLKGHLKLHDPSGRPFQCPLCLRHFQQIQHLQNHCIVHTKEEPFGCGHCEFPASFRPAVLRHISSSHAKIPFPSVVHLLDDRECLDCKVTLPFAEFLVHSIGHVVPVVMIERLETIRL